MTFLDKLERKIGWLTFPHLLGVLILGQLMVYVALVTGQIDLEQLVLNSFYVRMGEGYRLLTFMIMPMTTSPLWLLIGLYVTWLIGGALEREWGEFRFSLFVLLAWAFTVAASFAVPLGVYTNFYIMSLLTLAFAKLHPEFEFLLFFILPVKVKYIGWVIWGLFLIDLVSGELWERASVIAVILTYLAFFGKELMMDLNGRKRAHAFRQKAAPETGAAFHTCSRCGITDKKDPDRVFRYLSGNECVCEPCLNGETK